MQVDLTTDLTTADERVGTFKLRGNPLNGAALVEVVSGGGGGGGGDASAANQLLTNAALGTPVASPAANTLLARVKDLLTGIVLATGTNLIGAVSQTKTTISATTTMQNAVSATGNGATLDVAGYSVATILVTGTFVATLTFEASTDDSNWYAISATNVGNTSISTTATTPGVYRLTIGGFKSIRTRVTWISGTSVTIVGSATLADAPPKVVNSLLPFTLAGEDIPNDVLKVEGRYNATNITTQTTTVVKSGAGLLKRIVFNKPLASGVVAIYDNTAGSGNLIATITLPATLINGPFFLDYDDVVATGITVVTSGAMQDITIIYR